MSVSLAVAESVTEVLVPVAASAGAVSVADGGSFVPLPPPVRGAPAIQSGAATRLAEGAPATLEPAVAPEPSFRP